MLVNNILSMLIPLFLSLSKYQFFLYSSHERKGNNEIFNVEHHENTRVKGKEAKFPFHNIEKKTFSPLDNSTWFSDAIKAVLLVVWNKKLLYSRKSAL